MLPKTITKPIRFVVKPTNTPDTRLAESAQCVYLAAAQFARKDITSENVRTTMVRCASRVAVDMNTKDIVDKLSPTWQRSSEKIANHLRVYLVKKYNRTDFTFHRNSPVVKQIYSKFAELNKKEGKIFAQADKWQPADIWAISGKVDVSKAKTIDHLNQILRQKITSGLIVPISLKQSTGAKVVKVEPANITGVVATTDEKAQPTFKSTMISTGGTDWTSSKMVKINFQLGPTKQGYFELRQSKPGADVNAETILRGSTNRHGKLNKTVIVNAIRNAGGTISVPDEKRINEQSIANDPQLIQDTYTLANKIDQRFHNSLSFSDFTQFINTKHRTDKNWLASKYVGMLYVEAINKLSQVKKDQVIAEIYSHALVLGELAAPYLKVE